MRERFNSFVTWFPWSICNGCGMPAGNAYPSRHLVPSPILGLANAPIVETNFLELAMSLLDFSPRIPLGTFSILLTVELCNRIREFSNSIKELSIVANTSAIWTNDGIREISNSITELSN